MVKTIDDSYENLAKALDDLPNGFPRTQSNIEIAILRKFFSPQEAFLASHLGLKMEPIDSIANRVGLSIEEAENKLREMANRGLLWFSKEDENPRFRLAPFIVGIYESQKEIMDHELAHLVEDYLGNARADFGRLTV